MSQTIHMRRFVRGTARTLCKDIVRATTSPSIAKVTCKVCRAKYVAPPV